ncbi:MAG TPA: gephyrin-like molybdotransferase Glp [Acidiferrobacterales bacterium]|nr:gephyrin-like molybdotransferase Glp [Acidiferrobacterales bacterium]
MATPPSEHTTMLSLAEAQAAILARIQPATRSEAPALARAHGRYAAAALHARVDNPAFDNSAMDGYALNSRDLAGHAGVLPVLGESSCGSAPQQLAPGTAMRIFTGAPLPAGADTVVMQEDVERAGEQARFPQNTRAGDHVRRRGDDFRAGDVLYAPGRRLSAYDLALLSAAGIAEVSVYARPRVLVVATGDELVAPGQPLRPGQIYESNRLVTLLQLEALGAEAVDGGTVRDDPAALRALLKGAGDYDFIITSGGVSVGDHDLVKQVFAEIGEISFWKARIKPGKPVAFGRVGARTHFFALPGNPVSSLVTFKLFVEPALYAWHHSQPPVLELPAIAANSFQRKPGRMEFLRARLWSENGELRAEVLAGQGSHQIGTLRHTNGFIRVGEDSQGFAAGERVSALPLF